LLYGIPEAVFVALVAYGILVIIGTLTTATIAFKIYRKAKPGLEKMHSLGNLNPELIAAELEKRFPVMVHNATVEMIDSGAFDGLVERFGPEIVQMGQTIGQNIATVTFAKLSEKVTGQQGGIQKGVNYEQRRIEAAQFAQAIGSEEMAEAIDEFAADNNIPIGLARQFAPGIIGFVQQKFGHMIPGQAQPNPQAGVPSNGPRHQISQSSGNWL